MDTPEPNAACRDPAEPPPRKLSFREPPPPPPEKLPPPPDAYEILEQNKQLEAGLPINGTVPEHRAHTRRLRHWREGMVIVNGAMLLFMFITRNPAVIFFGMCGMVMFSCAFSWMMLKVLDNY